MVHRGVYAVGRRRLTRHGEWMAAVLACGEGAVLSHDSAAALWGVRKDRPRTPIHVSLPSRGGGRERPGIAVHRRKLGAADVTARHGIPVTTIALTLVDLAAMLDRTKLERAISEADSLGLVDLERLRAAIDAMTYPGAAALRKTLDRHSFRLTDSELEQLFLPRARRAGLPPPETRRYVNSFRVDFLWPELNLVVEADSLTYHRTPG